MLREFVDKHWALLYLCRACQFFNDPKMIFLAITFSFYNLHYIEIRIEINIVFNTALDFHKVPLGPLCSLFFSHVALALSTFFFVCESQTRVRLVVSLTLLANKHLLFEVIVHSISIENNIYLQFFDSHCQSIPTFEIIVHEIIKLMFSLLTDLKINQ